MLTICRLSEKAKAGLEGTFGKTAETAELEFKELPYFLVSRSRSEWNPEKKDIDSILILDVNDRGVLVDPERPDGKTRMTLIPWSNVITLSLVSSDENG